MKVVQWSQSRKPTEKEEKPVSRKRTLKEVAGSMLSEMTEKAHEERMKAIQQKQREQEDEIAAMTFGPNWRDNSPDLMLSKSSLSNPSEEEAAE